LRSYRELPLRLAELGVVHRPEPSGCLQGLFRLRQFTQDDGHVFCREEQLSGELERFCRALPELYAHLTLCSTLLGFPTLRSGSPSPGGVE
jgi:threonyl-tRNA synthetase